MINFEQIEMNEAMIKIGGGNKDGNLYFYDGADLRKYDDYNIDSKRLCKLKWFVKADAKLSD